ncbi:MAG: bifunctional phosphoribosylaminoimidazolecarboxamide formyltransferase/IMP cyclohydrolase [Rhodobacteraceae bacterium]|nr:bifunctional phosphoribosylaminoimidazolecarboxamide formyltransferase/IMP cyclohydrolase [Paracoccaceae bacterium]
MTTGPITIRRALLSVSDKSRLVELGRALAGYGVEMVSTGGTATALREAGVDVQGVSDLTGFPEIMESRVKTLHPKVHGGLLARRDNAGHIAAMDAYGIAPIDLLVVNLYPFEETVAAGADYGTCVENIDIGGPAMIRAASKNHAFVTVVVDPQDYGVLLAEMAAGGGAVPYCLRQALAQTAYARTATYDAAVSGWMAGMIGTDAPRRCAVAGELTRTLRYGENPHQAAAFYSDSSARSGVATAIQHQGKELSYNNISDTDAALELVAEFDPDDGPACAIIKHANPCGVARGATLPDAYTKAFNCDRASAFGGIVAFNHEIDAETAAKVAEIFTEVVVAPAATNEARLAFAAKKNLRLLTIGTLPDPAAPGKVWKQVAGGYLVQDRDAGQASPADWKTVTKRAPTVREMADMHVAWSIAKHVKSNAVVYVRDGATVGIGAGQMSRVDSAKIAAVKAERMAADLGLPQSPAIGSVVASDAFFPFADGLMETVCAGATAVIQPGGAMRDNEVIERADAAGLAMVFTGMRHFRH